MQKNMKTAKRKYTCYRSYKLEMYIGLFVHYAVS